MVIFGEFPSIRGGFSVNYIDKILAFCKEHHISETRFAKEAGLAKGLLPKWKKKEEGFRPHQDSLRKVAARMNISVEDLMCETPVELHSAAGDIVRDSAIRYIPVLNDIPDEWPVPDEEIITHLTTLPENLKDSSDCYGFMIRDKSMAPDIDRGDIAIVKLDDNPASNDIVIVSTPGEATMCRRLKRQKDGIILQPYCKHFDPIFYSYSEMDLLPVFFSGKVVALVRPLNSSSASVQEE